MGTPFSYAVVPLTVSPWGNCRQRPCLSTGTGKGTQKNTGCPEGHSFMLSEMCWLLTVPKTQMFSMPGQSQWSMESEARTQ